MSNLSPAFMATMSGTQCQPSRDAWSLESESQSLGHWVAMGTLLLFGFIGLGFTWFEIMLMCVSLKMARCIISCCWNRVLTPPCFEVSPPPQPSLSSHTPRPPALSAPSRPKASTRAKHMNLKPIPKLNLKKKRHDGSIFESGTPFVPHRRTVRVDSHSPPPSVCFSTANNHQTEPAATFDDSVAPAKTSIKHLVLEKPARNTRQPERVDTTAPPAPTSSTASNAPSTTSPPTDAVFHYPDEQHWWPLSPTQYFTVLPAPTPSLPEDNVFHYPEEAYWWSLPPAVLHYPNEAYWWTLPSTATPDPAVQYWSPPSHAVVEPPVPTDLHDPMNIDEPLDSFKQGVSQSPDDPWIDKLAMKFGRLSLHDTDDPAVSNLVELFSRLGIDDSVQELTRLFDSITLTDHQLQSSMNDLIDRFAQLDIQVDPMDELTRRFSALRIVEDVTQLAEEFARLSL